MQSSIDTCTLCNLQCHGNVEQCIYSVCLCVCVQKVYGLLQSSVINITLILFLTLKFSVSEDYMRISQQLVFSASDTRFEMDIPIQDDQINEQAEQFLALLTLGESQTESNVQLSPREATIEITDNDGKVKFCSIIIPMIIMVLSFR